MKRLKKDKPNPKSLNPGEEVILERATEEIHEHLDSLTAMIEKKREREKFAIKVKKTKFSTSKARNLTTGETVAALVYTKELSHIQNLKSAELHHHI